LSKRSGCAARVGGARHNIQGVPALHLSHVSNQPTLLQTVAMERQLAGPAEDKVMPNVEIGQTIASSGIGAVLDAVTRLGVFVHRFRIGVGRVELQTTAK